MKIKKNKKINKWNQLIIGEKFIMITKLFIMTFRLPTIHKKEQILLKWVLMFASQRTNTGFKN